MHRWFAACALLACVVSIGCGKELPTSVTYDKVESMNFLYAVGDNLCPYKNITILMTPGQKSTEINLSDQNVQRHYAIRDIKVTNRTCEYFIFVRMSPILRRLIFTSKYSLPCHFLQNSQFKKILNQELTLRKMHIAKACDKDCSLLFPDSEPIYNCADDVLTVIWKTDQWFTVNNREVPSVIRNKTQPTLNNYQIMKDLGIFLPFQTSPTVSAIKNRDGEVVRALLLSSCPDKTKTYDSKRDTCS
ncbi:hypothetical protein EB796_019850 [Bugula neritina]|uniref:Uncharacterized protein n=1 Tax=Bugula neritina TaxID=10212 RepID=A0A7J7J6H1_BUGNE|nr:hypothetical protein EB796_019850 [Bugula neritina]